MSQTASSVQLATFCLDKEWFGIDVLQVQEVIMPQEITSVPRAGQEIVGLINVRGVIVTCLSLKHILGFRDPSYGTDYRNIIIEDPQEQTTVCILVDEVGDVISPEGHCFAERPAGIPPQAGPFIKGVYRLDSGLVTLLDAQSILRCQP